MSIRLLHTADWQLGKPFKQIEGDAGAILRDARYKAVERLGALAREGGADLIVVAGDVFDGEALPNSALYKAVQAMRGFDGAWLLLPGNHDPAKPGGVWERLVRLGLPDNVRPLCEPGPVPLLDGRLVVLPAPLRIRHALDDLSAWMDAADSPSGAVRLGLAHGSVSGIVQTRDEAPATNPIARDRARKAALDYLALGDWHGAMGLDDRTWYSGTPEPDRYTANDSGNVLMVQLPGPGASPVVERHRTGAYHWQALDHELMPTEDEGGALRPLEDVLEGLADPAETVLRLRLEGRMRPNVHGDLMALEERWRGRLHHFEMDDAGIEVEAETADLGLHAADPLVKEVAERLADRAGTGGEEARRARMALRLLHHTLAGLPR